MAFDAENVEENFNKFVQSIDQYVKEPIKDVASIKPQLLDIFKTHCPIKVGDYEYGMSKSLEENSQLIIHHLKNDHSLVREYFKSENDTWTCCECYSTSSAGESSEEDIAYALVLHGIVFAKLGHYCKPRRLSVVMNIQKCFREKKVAKAVDLQRKHFGKEDLNGVSSKRKRGSSKRETKASKIVDEMTSEVPLQYAQKNHRDSQDDEPSIMDENSNENQEKLPPKESFTKIIENLEEYTNETKEAIMANKSKILTYLKTHRPVKLQDYHYGLTLNLRKNRRIIVFEWDDRRRVREYSKKSHDKNLWICRECFRLYRYQRIRTSYTYLYLVNGIAFVELDHHCYCKPRDYEIVMIYQKFLEEGDTASARAMARSRDFSYGQSYLVGTINKLDGTYASLPTQTATSNDAKFMDELPDRKKTKKKALAFEDNVIDDLTAHQQLEIAKLEKESIISTTSMYHFEKPSTLKLEQTCHKLNIRYRIQANKFWDKIKFDQINILSTRIQLHSYKMRTFYQILSIFFTGKSKQHEQIQATIIDAFREKLISSGELSIKKFNKQYLDTVTDEHFAFIAKFLKCRILIFDGENGIKKYGKWKSTSSIRLTLVVALIDGYYSIVLSL